MTWATGKDRQTTPKASEKLYAWVVIEGPISVADLCECGEPECELLDAPEHMLLVRCTVGDSPEMFDYEMYLDSFNSAYDFKKDIQNSVEPLVIGEVTR